VANENEFKREVYKSRAVEALDDFFSAGDDPSALSNNYEYARQLLESDEGLAAIASRFQEQKRVRLPGDSQHFAEVWLDDPDVEPLMRQRYLEAIDLASREEPYGPRPIVTFWVTGTVDKFDMKVSDGADQVTVHVFIPQGLVERARPPAPDSSSA
jgi:hypothetical protein